MANVSDHFLHSYNTHSSIESTRECEAIRDNGKNVCTCSTLLRKGLLSLTTFFTVYLPQSVALLRCPSLITIDYLLGHSILSLLAILCLAHNNWIFSATSEEPPFE